MLVCGYSAFLVQQGGRAKPWKQALGFPGPPPAAGRVDMPTCSNTGLGCGLAVVGGGFVFFLSSEKKEISRTSSNSWLCLGEVLPAIC